MSAYVNLDNVLEYLDAVRSNRNVNTNPYMDNALLNVRQMLDHTILLNPFMTDWVIIGECNGCIYKNNRHQKCSCCRRNRKLKDCYKENEEQWIN